MSHPFNQLQFRTWNSLSSCSSTANIAHAICESMDYEGWSLQVPKTFGSIA